MTLSSSGFSIGTVTSPGWAESDMESMVLTESGTQIRLFTDSEILLIGEHCS
jgi:hypothetical protein